MYATRKVNKVISKYNKIFSYYNNKGSKITDKTTLEYIKNLKIPPGYDKVKINLNKNAKLLATGYDVKGKKQYIYNEKWIKKRSTEKFCKMIEFSNVIPRIYRNTNKCLNSNSNDYEKERDKVISLIIRIIMECNFRIGNPIGKDVYNSFGVSTLQKQHIKFKNGKAIIDFIGKKGVRNVCVLKDKKLNNVLKKIVDKTKKNKDPIFTAHNGNRPICITSNDVNEYLKQYGDFTTKDFRTWFANIYFLDEMSKYKKIPDTITHRKKYAREAIKKVAERLHHTVAVCKKKYIATDMIDLYIEKPNNFKKIVLKNYKTPEQSFVAYLQKYC